MIKMKHYIIMFVVTLFFMSCNTTEFEPVPKERLMGEKWTSTTTVKEVLDTYMTNYDQYTDTATKNAGLFTADSIPSTPSSIINGIITTSDVEGNIYKYIIVQEEEPNGMAVKISIDASGLSSIYPIGTRVSVDLGGLYVGKYAQSPQIGVYYENMTRYKENTETGKRFYRVEPGRMPFPIARKHISAYGDPEPEAIKADTLTIAQIKAGGPKLYNKLVVIKNAYFTGRGAYSGRPTLISDDQMIFAPSTDGVGYPQSREIQDGTGNIFIATSEFARFANKPIPPSAYIGYITAIVGWYNDKDVALNNTKIYHQLTIRSLKDLGAGFEGYHESIK